MARKTLGFTLIELLIVVAIIAILAAIAVPNFLEAQTRSKVARCKNDLRTLATAMEAYCIDNNNYPNDQDDDPDSPRTKEGGFLFLTSPVAFITSRPNDPFGSNQHFVNNVTKHSPIYQMATGVDSQTVARARPTLADPAAYPNVKAYLIFGNGPNMAQTPENIKMSNDDWPYLEVTFTVYDPTNGTVSNGQIGRFGGQYMVGDWKYNGVDHHQAGSIPQQP